MAEQQWDITVIGDGIIGLAAAMELLTRRTSALERLRYYQRLLGLPMDQNAPETLTLNRREGTEENFDAAYSSLVGQYDKPLTQQTLPTLRLA